MSWVDILLRLAAFAARPFFAERAEPLTRRKPSRLHPFISANATESAKAPAISALWLLFGSPPLACALSGHWRTFSIGRMPGSLLGSPTHRAPPHRARGRWLLAGDAPACGN